MVNLKDKTLGLATVCFSSLAWISRSQSANVAETQLFLSHVAMQVVKPAFYGL